MRCPLPLNVLALSLALGVAGTASARNAGPTGRTPEATDRTGQQARSRQHPTAA